jgi:hypothetical protein
MLFRNRNWQELDVKQSTRAAWSREVSSPSAPLVREMQPWLTLQRANPVCEHCVRIGVCRLPFLWRMCPKFSFREIIRKSQPGAMFNVVTWRFVESAFESENFKLSIQSHNPRPYLPPFIPSEPTELGSDRLPFIPALFFPTSHPWIAGERCRACSNK